MAPILLLLLILFIIALVYFSFIYLIALPLFVNIWILDLIGVPEMLPIWVALVGIVATVHIIQNEIHIGLLQTVVRGTVGISICTVSSLVFVAVWQTLEAKHQYFRGQDPFLNPGKYCYDYVTACLTFGGPSPFPDGRMKIIAIVSGLVFYVGLGVWGSSIKR